MSTSYLHVGYHLSKKPILSIWSGLGSLIKWLSALEMELMMFRWFNLLMLALVFLEKKDSKLLEVLTMPLDNLCFWSRLCLFMEEKLIEGIQFWYCIVYIKIFCMLLFSTSLEYGQDSVDKLFTIHLCISFIIFFMHLRHLCIIHFLISNIKRILIKTREEKKVKNILWEILICIKLELNICVLGKLFL